MNKILTAGMLVVLFSGCNTQDNYMKFYRSGWKEGYRKAQLETELAAINQLYTACE